MWESVANLKTESNLKLHHNVKIESKNSQCRVDTPPSILLGFEPFDRMNKWMHGFLNPPGTWIKKGNMLRCDNFS